MAKKPAKPKHVEPEFESQELPEADAEADATPEASGGAVNQAELVRRAVAAGHEKPAAGVLYIKEEFGVEVDPRYFSVAKGNLKKKGGAPAAKPGRKPRMAKLERVVEEIQPAVGGGIIADLAAVKALVNKLGVAEVKKIADLFA